MTDLKLIVPKEIDNRINPEYTRHVKKFDMLSMPRRIDNVSGKHLTFEKGRYEVGLPLEAVREKGGFKFIIGGIALSIKCGEVMW